MHGAGVITPASTATAGLVEAARQGGEAAAEALIAAVWPRAYRIALSVAADPMLAEDAAQESCAILFRSIGKLRSAQAFGVWFYRIVVREALALERKSHLPEQHALPPHSQFEQTLLKIDVLKALGTLPSSQHAAIALHHYGEMTSPEIGQILGIPDSSVRFHILTTAWGITAFILSYVNYWLPGDKMFDEVYLARAAEEYLTNKYIYENTHPPLTKLIITLSTTLFGGIPRGDSPAGWRFMDVLFGALAVALLYIFAKRLTQSRLFGSFAALLLTVDGMHYVQSRIATPEGIVIVFSLAALYAFYRFQDATENAGAGTVWTPGVAEAARAGLAIVLGFVSSLLANRFGNPPGSMPMPDWIGGVSLLAAAAYFSFGWYLALRLFVAPRLDPRIEPVKLGASAVRWLIASPRITFAYHFYVNIPIVILCNVIVLQRIWEFRGTLGRALSTAYVVLCVAWFAWFFPMLNATPIAFAARDQRLLTWLSGRAWI